MNKNFLNEIDKSWSLFLDRDGVINERIINDYVKDRSQFHLLDGVAEAINLFKEKFGHVFVVTNQQGIGKGLMTENDLLDIHNYMQELIGVQFDRIYFCSSLEAGNSPRRKPNIGMALEAKKDFPLIDFSTSVMVGDSYSDILFGKNAGMKTVYIHSGKINNDADLNYPSLYQFAKNLSGKD
jgi:histidinol-phosphate phosphatase family protein